MLALLDAPQGALVVDFGTGTGTYALALAKLRTDLHIVALDEQPEMLELLVAKPEIRTLANVEPVGVDALPRLRERAERVLAINVLHEVGDAALGELRSLLAPGGIAVFIDWNADVERPVGPPRDHVYSSADARLRVEAAEMRITGQRLFPYHYALVAVRER